MWLLSPKSEKMKLLDVLTVIFPNVHEIIIKLITTNIACRIYPMQTFF